MNDKDDGIGLGTILFWGWVAYMLFGGCEIPTDTQTLDNKPGIEQHAPTQASPVAATQESWDPDSVNYESQVKDADELFKDTFSTVKDPFDSE